MEWAQNNQSKLWRWLWGAFVQIQVVLVNKNLWSSCFWQDSSPLLQFPGVRNHPESELESRKILLLEWSKDCWANRLQQWVLLAPALSGKYAGWVNTRVCGLNEAGTGKKELYILWVKKVNL